MKLNLGCGKDIKKGYLNLDFNFHRGVDIVCDVKSLPFPDESAEEIYASDIIEHFPWRETKGVLKEWWRVLKHQGKLWMRTPNLEGLLKLYQERPKGWRREGGKKAGVDPVVERIFGGQDYKGNYHFVIFDRVSIKRVMRECGFKVTEATNDGSDVSNMCVIAERTSDIDLIWDGPIFDPSGYADEGRNFVLALEEEGVNIHLIPLTTTEATVELENAKKERLDSMTENSAILSNEVTANNAILITHSTGDISYRHPFASYNIARMLFETDRIPERWLPTLMQMDEVWAPSYFNLETFSFSGLDRKKIKVIPGALNVESFRQDIEPLEIPGRKSFNFLSVFDWLPRKGWDVLLEAYIKEFKRDEDVALILKVYKLATGYEEKTVKEYRERLHRFVKDRLGLDSSNIPEIIFLPMILSASDMPRLYAAADAFVMTSHGEGWGRPYFEAMAMGLPTIGTRWSGQLDYMNDNNSYLIDCDIVDVPPSAWREVPLWRGHKWAQPSVAHTRKLMREVYENRQEAREKGERARKEIIENFNYPTVAKKMIKRLREIRSILGKKEKGK